MAELGSPGSVLHTLRLDHYEIDWKNLYSEDELVDVDLEGLVKGLEHLPCCVTDKSQKSTGDPLNIAIVGNNKDVYYAFMRAGWDETETIYGGSLWRTIKSSLSGSEYRYSPVSALYVFGRPQDVALQKGPLLCRCTKPSTVVAYSHAFRG